MEKYSVDFNRKKVYNKASFSEVVDRSFKEFGQEPSESVKTVEQFFLDYEDLFFQIPATGSANSHQYLIERSSQLYKLNQELIDVQPLIDEITALKTQNVEYQQTIIDLRIQLGSSEIK